MRSSRLRRKKRWSHLSIAKTILIVSACAAALAGMVTETLAAQGAPSLQAKVWPRRLTLNHPVLVTGTAPASEAGHSAVLETALTSAGGWRPVASASISANGAFRITTRLKHSGYLRVVDGSATATTVSLATASSTVSPSAPQRVLVRGQFQVAAVARNVLGGGNVVIRGHLRPAAAGRSVRLQARFGRAWRTLGRGRTGSRGGFKIRAAAPGGMSRGLRVVFAGDAANTRTTRSAGRLTVYTADVASWYDDAGNTACGYHAGLGVANRTLPCGTKVRFLYGGRAVTATVDDRGPYVGGRNWDLNQNTAAALGFGGVGTVWVSQ